MAINNVILEGRLTFEPELRATTNGKSVVNFSVAVPRSYAKKNEERQSDFISCTAFGSTAEFVSKYFHKGSPIEVIGSIQTNKYTDKDGKSRIATNVIANQVAFVTAPAKTENSEANEFSQPAPTYASADNSDFEEIIDDDDDLPF